MKNFWTLIITTAALLLLLAGNTVAGIVDNNDAGTSFTGTWQVSSGVDPYGSDSVWGGDGATYTWTEDIVTDGVYEVYAWWTEYPRRTDKAEYTVTHAEGSSTVFANQTKDGGQWNLVGRYQFNSSQMANVTLMARDSKPATYSADAIKFVHVPGEVIDEPSETNLVPRTENDDAVAWQAMIASDYGVNS